MKRTVFLCLGALVGMAAASATAADPTFEGSFAQGGLVVGHAATGSRVEVDGKPVRVSPDGLFLMGFGRDAGASVTVRVTNPSGGTSTQTLAVAARRFPTERIEGLPPQQVTPDAKTLARIRAEALLIEKAREADSAEPFFRAGFAWPVKGRLSGVFGSQRILNGEPRAPHGGIDISAASGTIVAAASDGVVALAHPDMFLTGKTVMIDHGHGLTTVYAHMSEILVRPGERVRRGAPIGKVGASGRASGPHLHWGISLFDSKLDPALLVPPLAKSE